MGGRLVFTEPDVRALLRPYVELGEELRDKGSGSMVLETGFALNVTLRAVRGRPVSCRRRGVRSEPELAELAEAFGERSMTTKSGEASWMRCSWECRGRSRRRQAGTSLSTT